MRTTTPHSRYVVPHRRTSGCSPFNADVALAASRACCVGRAREGSGVDNISVALGGPLPAEVDFSATVTSAPRYFTGTVTHARHEAFDTRTSDGLALEVVDNIDLAPPISVVPGDHIAVRGELVSDPGRGPLVHWTHHDPAGQHPDGWIDFAGRRYA